MCSQVHSIVTCIHQPLKTYLEHAWSNATQAIMRGHELVLQDAGRAGSFATTGSWGGYKKQKVGHSGKDDDGEIVKVDDDHDDNDNGHDEPAMSVGTKEVNADGNNNKQWTRLRRIRRRRPPRWTWRRIRRRRSPRWLMPSPCSGPAREFPPQSKAVGGAWHHRVGGSRHVQHPEAG